MRVVLLHGLLRTKRSMQALVAPLVRDGHEVHALTYPSHRLGYRALLQNVAEQLRALRLLGEPTRVAFVGHSMGGLVWRDLPQVLPGLRTGRGVVLGSPLQGSVAARTLGQGALARLCLGASGEEIRKARNDDVSFPGELATVAGTRWSPLTPAAFVLRLVAPGEPSDSTVLVREARSRHERAHVTVDAAHDFMPDNPDVVRFVREFLGA